MNPEAYSTDKNEEFDYDSTELLTAEEEVELAMQMEAGKSAAQELQDAELEGIILDRERRRELQRQEALGVRARDRFIISNTGLVRFHARKYIGSGIEFEDLVQYGLGAVEGNRGPRQTGLIHAVDKYDYRKDVRFAAYATPWINNALQNATRFNRSPIQLPHNVEQDIYRLYDAEKRVTQRLGKKPDDADLAAEMDRDIADIVELKTYRTYYWQPGAVSSLDALADSGRDGQSDNGDSSHLIPDNSTNPDNETFSDNLELSRALGQLSARQQVIISMAHDFGYSTKEIAAQTGYSQRTVRDDHRAALAILRRILEGGTVDVEADEVEAVPAKTDSTEVQPSVHEEIKAIESGPPLAAMSFAELLTGHRYRIAVERMQALNEPKNNALIAQHFPGSLSTGDHAPVRIVMSQARTKTVLDKAETMLRSIIDGSIDYGEVRAARGKPRHFLIFMGKAGMLIPDDANLDTLREQCNIQLNEADFLDDKVKKIVIDCFNLDGSDTHVTPMVLAEQYGMTYEGIISTINDAAAKLAEANAQKALYGKRLADTRTPDGHDRTVDDEQQEIEVLASKVPLETWFGDPRLRVIAERALSLLTTQQAATIAGRYGFSVPARSTKQLAEDLSISVPAVEQCRADANRQLAVIMPAIAAGTYDYTIPKSEDANCLPSVLEFMARTGLDVPPHAELLALRASARLELNKFQAISARDKLIVAAYFGLESNGKRRDVNEAAAAFGYSRRSSYRKQVVKVCRYMLHESIASSHERSRITQPILTAQELGSILA